MTEIHIPSITDKKLNDLRQHIQPVASFVEILNPNDWSKPLIIDNDRQRHFLWQVYAEKLGLDTEAPQLLRLATIGDPRRTSFLGNPLPVGIADSLTRVMDMVTYHTLSTFVNPSEAEVLAQIPEQLTHLVVAYQAHYEPTALRIVSEGINSYHAVLTRLYKRQTV